MLNKIKIVLLVVFGLMAGAAQAISWDEPWVDTVIKEADCFVLAKVDSFNVRNGVYIEIIKVLGGTQISGKISITNFYHLDLCSMSSGDFPYFHFRGIKECYFFLKKNAKGEYCIATPTTGFDLIKDSNVISAYRHSFHKALVPKDIYEKTMTAIFNNYHGLPYDSKFINDFVEKYLSLSPAGANKLEINTFFLQHVALECIHHLKLSGLYAKIIPFLNDTSNAHAQVSAARALVAYNTKDCEAALLKVIGDTTRGCFVRVICVWTLKNFRPAELKDKLEKISAAAASKECGFGADIMDDRICTHFPDVKGAIDDLIAEIK